MPSAPFPNDPSQRRAILVLDRDAYDALGYEEGGPDLLRNPEVHVIPFPAEGDTPVLQKLRAEQVLSPGAVLLQSPFHLDDYAEVEDAPDRFARAKYHAFARVCQALGAKKVVVKQIEVDASKSSVTLDVQADHVTKSSGKGKIAHERAEKLRRELKMTHEYGEGNPNPDVNQAMAIIQEKGLSGDLTLRELVESAGYEGNRLTRYELSINLSRETTAKLRVLADLKTPAFVKLKGDFKRTVEEQAEYTLTVEVDF